MNPINCCNRTIVVACCGYLVFALVERGDEFDGFLDLWQVALVHFVREEK
jgi:hypothetical protein